MDLAFLMLVIVALVTGIVAVGYMMERKRTEAIRQVAEELGLTFYPSGDGQPLAALAGLYLFSRGHSKKITNVMQGEANDVEVKILDYKYVIGSGKSAQTLKQTVVCFRSPELDLPNFSLRPEGFLHKVRAFFGYQDINFDTHPQFSKHYLLRGTNEASIRGLFHEGALSFYDDRPGLCTEGNRERLVFYRAGRREKPEQMRSFLAEGFEILALFKP